MSTDTDDSRRAPPPGTTAASLATEAPSPWITRWCSLVAPGARVLDVACGGGRHARLFRQRGCRVTAVDRDLAALAALEKDGIATVLADLEAGPGAGAWPFAAGSFDAVVVTNYLYRPLFPDLVAALSANGVLLYETFAVGNERLGRPSNPAFLLRRNELFEQFGNQLNVVCFEQGLVAAPKPAVVQRICAVKGEQWRPEPLEQGR
jgi:SAM-dependent methyltransferase